MKKRLLLMLLGGGLQMALAPVSAQTCRERAESLVSKMTLEEKASLVSGQVDGFHTAAIPRLGIPSIRMADGPQGVRNKTRSTFYPCGISVASTGNPDLAREMGRGLALDARARGIGIMLGPGVNIYRSALCGRNFEYYGEDPVLASAIACGYIEGMQQNGVIATIKHFAANNQEYRRHATNSVVDERTLRELYFPVFKDAVQKAGVGAVMTSYNPLNGIHSAENRWLITDVLRKEWGFDGIVMSDWTSTYTTLGCMESGLDLEMPKGYWLNYKMIRELLDRGIVHERQLDEKCVHILSTLIRFGLLDRPAVDSALPLDNEECRRIAYATALEGPVLLKNAGALPLDRAALKRVAVIGPNADRIPFGGGSGEVTPIEGCSTTLFSGLCAVAGREHVDTIRFGADGSFDEKAVSRASAVVVSVGFTKETEGEGFDRTFSLPEGQDELIRRVAGLNDRVVVVVNSGGEVAMPWLDEVEAVVMAWYPGQEGGRALASILSGMESPSGRLPVTFWGTLEGNPAAVYYGMRKNEIVPQKRDPFCHTVYYEGLFSGYRAAGSAGFAPLFPFGFGLTYSLFAYSDLSIQPAADGYDVSFWVRNVGKCRAADVPQVYVSECNPREPRPAKLLKGFAKVTLSADEKTRVSVHLGKDAFSHYDVASGEFRVSPGVFEVIVGANAREESLKTSLTIE